MTAFFRQGLAFAIAVHVPEASNVFFEDTLKLHLLLMGIGAGSKGCYQRWSHVLASATNEVYRHAPSPNYPALRIPGWTAEQLGRVNVNLQSSSVYILGPQNGSRHWMEGEDRILRASLQVQRDFGLPKRHFLGGKKKV